MHRLIPSESPASGNFCDLILRHAKSQPWVSALITDGDQPSTLSFGELAVAISRFRQRCRDLDWQTGEPVVLMLKPSPALYVAVLGLLAEGLIPVFIDRGLGSKRMLQALKLSGARRVIASPKLARLGRLLTVTGNVKWYEESDLLEPLTNSAAVDWHWGVPVTEHSHGLISYTSGTTGRPKGADRTHTSLIAQHQAIRSHWPDQGCDIDMTCLPVLVLHNLCCGMPTVLPDMDFAAPARVDGRRVLEQIRQHEVSRISGAPAFIQCIARAASDTAAPMSLRSVRVGGAPVGSKLASELMQALPNADIAVVYGSTEAEPIAHINAGEIAADAGMGYPVGRAVEQTTMIRIAEQDHISTEGELRQLKVTDDEAGEIIVKGPHVLRGYVNDTEATRENKIPADSGEVWHRTGDIAVVDATQTLRLLGRRSDAIQWQGTTLYPFPLERQLQDLPGIRQAALVQSAPGEPPKLFISLDTKHADKKSAMSLGKESLKQLGFDDVAIHILKDLPVDSRHNSKILRAPLRKKCP